MEISKSMFSYVTNIYASVSSRLRRVMQEGKVRKEYIQTLSEFQSFLAMLRDLLKRVACLETAYPELKYGRICHRWFYSEYDGLKILTKIEPRLVISYDGSSIKVSYDDREAIVRGLELEFLINMYRDRVSLEKPEETLDKRSLILEVLGKLKAALDHVRQDFELCIKELRLKC